MLNLFLRRFLILWTGIILVYNHASQAGEQQVDRQSSFTLWQLPARTPTQHMAYVLRSATGQVIVVDGGNQGDAEYLRGFLAALENRVDAWFISHPHQDHVDTLTSILKSPGKLHIKHIYGSLPEGSWVEKHEADSLPTIQQLNLALQESGHEVEELTLGQRLDIDGLHIDILGIKNPEIHGNAINNSSVVFRVFDSVKSVLFTGDLGVQGGEKLLETKYKSQLPSDYVQMAHHGQAGVGLQFYRAVKPRYCLWPTPAWLWDNDNGAGSGSGPWQTLKVRGWMDDLNVERHFLSARGMVRID